MHPIVAGLLKLARKIGKWLLDVAARRGATWLADYIEERAGVFRTRLARVSARKTDAAKRRAAWLRGRIARWVAAAKWLRENAGLIDDQALAIARELPAVKRLADVVPDEVEPRAAA